MGGFGTSRTRNEILFADYSVTVPRAPGVVSVEDNGILDFQLWLPIVSHHLRNPIPSSIDYLYDDSPEVRGNACEFTDGLV